MKNNFPFILAICFLASLAFLVAGQKENPQWKGTIEVEDGIKIVKNPNKPLYGDIEFELEEDLSIGNDEDENYLFYHAGQVEVDEQGNIYVIDTRNYRVQVFDDHGKYRMTIGRDGQGPGEFEIPVRIRINENTRNIYVQDQAYTIEIFDDKGEHIDALHLSDSLKEFWLFSDDNFIAIVSKRKNTLEYTHILCTLDSSGQLKKNYTQAPFVSGKIGNSGLLSTPFNNVLLLSKLDNRTYVYCYSPEYGLIVIDIDGNMLLKIRKEEPRPKYTSKEKKAYEKARSATNREIILPENKPYIYAILTDDEGLIYAKRNYVLRSELRSKIKYDVFSRDGHYLYETSLPRNTYVIRLGFLYARLEEDEEGLECVKRYKIKNWSEIKKGIS